MAIGGVRGNMVSLGRQGIQGGSRVSGETGWSRGSGETGDTGTGDRDKTGTRKGQDRF